MKNSQEGKGGWVVSLLVLGVVSLIVVAVCPQQASEEGKVQLTEAQAHANELMQEQIVRGQKLDVAYARLVIGPIAASTLDLCYMKGYSGLAHPPDQAVGPLSRRETAECAQIVRRLEKERKRHDEEEARKDAEYESAPPVKPLLLR